MGNTDSWHELKKSVSEKFKRSLSNPTLVLFSFAAIILLGNLGFWMELISFQTSESCSLEPLVKSLIAFFPAVAIPACMQMNISDDKSSKSEKALSLFVAVILAGLAIFLLKIPKTLDNFWLLIVCGLLSIVAYVIWLIINADNVDFKRPSSDAAVGGSVKQKLSGSLEGIRS